MIVHDNTEIHRLYTVDELLTVLELMETALEGDGSTSTMPDVTPAEAARWILSTLDKHGYEIVKTNGERLT